MILLAHIFMVPVEEVMLPLVSGVGSGAAVLLAAWLSPFRAKSRY